MNTVYFSLGSNVDDRIQHIHNALHDISNTIGPIQTISSYYQTKAWGNNLLPDFINICIKVKTILSADEVLKKTLTIELNLGRLRNDNKQYQSRTIDIDILFYNSDVINTNQLQVPHNKLHQRNFVLKPLLEITPNFIHPVLLKTIAVLNQECKDTLQVTKTEG